MSEAAGRFVYWELRTSDPEGAAAFYHGLFGWEWTDGRGHLDERPILDVVSREPARWVCHAAVGDLDMACELVVDHDGRLDTEPHDVPGVGRAAVLVDRWGATFGLVELDEDLGDADPIVGAIGAQEWTVLVTPEVDDALVFYLPILGWTAEQLDGGELGPYLLCHRAGDEAGGVIGTPPEALDPSFWLTCVRVPSVDEVTARAIELGAEVRRQPVTIADIGRFSVLADPQGARFAVLEVQS